MRRLLLLVLALLLPLQAAVATSVPQFCIAGADPAASSTLHADVTGVHKAPASMAGCDVQDLGSRVACSHYLCTHLGVTLLARAGPLFAPVGRMQAVSPAARVDFESVVLGVPLPPPEVTS